MTDRLPKEQVNPLQVGDRVRTSWKPKPNGGWSQVPLSEGVTGEVTSLDVAGWPWVRVDEGQGVAVCEFCPGDDTDGGYHWEVIR